MSEFEKMMEQLKMEYLAELPAKISDIQSCLASTKMPELRDHFHKLKGTGKTYGIPEISELGEAVEKLCVDSPKTALLVIPSAIELLKAIHEARSMEKSFELKDDPRFSNLQGSSDS